MISIIIVHYKAKKELFNCIESIRETVVDIPYEVIVVDNDTKEVIRKSLQKKYPKVRYVKSHINVGYGAGNNLGVAQANGDYILVLNPDTLLMPECLKNLLDYLEKHVKIGIVSPLILNKNKKPYLVQGTRKLGFVEGLVALSFLNEYFPNNPISHKYLIRDWNRKDIQEVDVIPGAAFMLKRNLYNEIGGFDETFFLYFEEVDLSRRVRDKGYKLIMLPSAKVVHIGGQSTKHLNNVNVYFQQSRKKYFTKYYGEVPTLFLEVFLTRIRHIFHFR